MPGLWEGAAQMVMLQGSRAEMPKAKPFQLNDCVNGSWGAGMGGLSTYAFSTVLAVNTPCACLGHLLGVHSVKLCRKKMRQRKNKWLLIFKLIC